MTLMSHFPDDARNLLVVRGKDLLDTLGLPALRSVVSQVMCGENIRSATEMLTRKRISLLNAALLTMYSSLAEEGSTTEEIASRAYEAHSTRGTSAEDKIVLRWILGLTTKQVQNVLRSNDEAWQSYISNLRTSIADASNQSQALFGDFPLASSKSSAPGLDWDWGLSLLTAIGSQTLGTRGAEKSMYGKFFEKMVLGSVLSLLGFTLEEGETGSPQSFWLSSRKDKRESDATLIWQGQKGIRFDIGFIGVGNTEITLDKVSRFQRVEDIAGKKHHMSTIIIVDRVGKNSRVEEMARDIDGVIVQMSYPNWAWLLGDQLEKALPGYKSPLAGLQDKHKAYVAAVQAGVGAAPLEQIFQIAVETDDGSDDETSEN
jgi:hypothetical protein